MNNFDKALDFVFSAEGGYSNRKNDSGKATNMGITQNTFNSVKDRNIIDTDITDVRYITKELATTIYKKEFWDKVKADQLPNGIDMIVFDMAITSAPADAVKTLQKVVGVKEDGIIGSDTISATYSYKGDLVKDFNNQRRVHNDTVIQENTKAREEDILKYGFTDRVDQSKNKNGWENRINNLEKFIDKYFEDMQKQEKTTINDDLGYKSIDNETAKRLWEHILKTDDVSLNNVKTFLDNEQDNNNSQENIKYEVLQESSQNLNVYRQMQ